MAKFAYGLGVTGNRISLVENVNGNNRAYNWVYDYLYRLTGETLGGGNVGTINYGYDAVGNRTSRTSSVATISSQTNSFTANDWLGSDQYDSNGNTTNSVATSYQYDPVDHLVKVNNGAILMAYDGDGNRVSKTAGGTTNYYLLDDRNPSGYSQVLEEWTTTSSGTNLVRVYNYGMSLVSQRQVSGITNTYYFVSDGHGSTRELIDYSGSVANVFSYDAYGNLIASNSIPQTKYLYCCQQFDGDLGLYYNRAR
jgi:YD repeat-containing protein